MVKKKTTNEEPKAPQEDSELDEIYAEAWGEKDNTNNKVSVSMLGKAIYCGIIGLGKVFAVASIAYTTYQVLTLTDDSFSKYAVIPQILLASVMAINAFIMVPIKLLMEKSKKSS